jgi:hypothetical protein
VVSRPNRLRFGPNSTYPPSQPKRNQRRLPQGRAKLVAYEVALELVAEIRRSDVGRGYGHPRDHLVRSAANTALRLSEASGRTLGNRYQHLEAAFAESQEVQSALEIIHALGGEIPTTVIRLADRTGGLVYGLLRAEARARRD